MLDLMTLGLSLGAQEEMNKAREAHGAELNQQQSETETSTAPSVLEQAAEAVGIFILNLQQKNESLKAATD